MSYSQSQNLSFQDDDDFLESQASYAFQDFTMPSQTQASQLDHSLESQVSFKFDIFKITDDAKVAEKNTR
jgi:hypothetical protein